MCFVTWEELCNKETKEEFRRRLKKYRERLNYLRSEYVILKRSPATLDAELANVLGCMHRVKYFIAACERIVL